MKTVCELNRCAGCGACVAKCPKNAVRVVDDLKALNATIAPALCVDCGLCERVCPVVNPVEATRPVEWRQGWAENEAVRAAASSGGVATALAQAFVENGGVVCSCVFRRGNFVFDFAETSDDVAKFAGSKYVKSDPTDAYAEILRTLKSGRKVLFIGLPCQVAGVRNFTGDNESLYTVDLICHGSPSPNILRMFLKERGYDAEMVDNVAFREKTEFFLSVDGRGVEPPTVRDRYVFAFLKSICYTENCYDCRYASLERVADITLGDSWGSELSETEQKKGVSLILRRTERGAELLESAELRLSDVDLDKAIANNRQLSKPSERPSERERFYDLLNKTGSFNKTIRKLYPKVCLRQRVKAALIRAKLLGKRGGGKD